MYSQCFCLLQEINRYKNEMCAVETAVAERMGYLQRYKVNITDCNCLKKKSR